LRNSKLLTEIFKNKDIKLVAMGNQSMSFIAMDIILFFAIIGFISIVFDLSGMLFMLELGALLVFAFFLAFAMFSVYKNDYSGWGVIGAVLIILMLNSFFVSIAALEFGIGNIMAIFFSAMGIAVVLANVLGSRDDIEPEIGRVEQDYYMPINKVELQP